MKKHGILAALSGMIAVFLAAAAVALVILCRGMKPVLLSIPEVAVQHTKKLMDAVCAGDFSEAEDLLYGTPDLGVDRMPSHPVGAMIWDAYVGSLDYTLVGEVYATEEGVAQNVKLISLELPTAMEHLGSRARDLLNEAVAEAEDVSELYDENNEYREELVEEILQEAARQALEEDVRYTYQVFPLQLVCSDGQWWAVADQTFLNVISSGITG